MTFAVYYIWWPDCDMLDVRLAIYGLFKSFIAHTKFLW